MGAKFNLKWVWSFIKCSSRDISISWEQKEHIINDVSDSKWNLLAEYISF
jgi:hypothetical protein